MAPRASQRNWRRARGGRPAAPRGKCVRCADARRNPRPHQGGAPSGAEGALGRFRAAARRARHDARPHQDGRGQDAARPRAWARRRAVARRPATSGRDFPLLGSAPCCASARARDWDGFARALRRALAILGDAPIDVAGLVRDVLFLNDATLRRWTYDYWQTRAPADDDPSQSASNEMETAP